MIRNISMSNIKGQSGIQELTGRDIFIGKNGSGKTTRLQAVSLAMLGYIPGEAKTLEEIHKKASGDFMGVGLKIDGFEFARSFIKEVKTDKSTGKTKSSIKQDITVVPSRGEKKLDEKENRITDTVGNSAISLDFNEFYNLTDSKRREFIYSLCGAEETLWNKESVREYIIKKAIDVTLQENNPDKYIVILECINEVLNLYDEEYMGIEEALVAMIDYASDKTTVWNREKKNSIGAVRKMSDIKNDLEETDRGLETDKTEYADLNKTLLELSEQIARDTEKKKAHDNRMARKACLEAQISEINSETNPLDPEAIKNRIEKLDPTKVVFDLSGELKKIDNEIDQIKADSTHAVTQVNCISKTIAELDAEEKYLNKALSDVKNNTGKCAIDSRIACDKDFTKFIAFSENRLKDIKLSRDILKQNWTDQSLLELKCKEKVETLVTKKDDLNKANHEIIKSNMDTVAIQLSLEAELDRANNFEKFRQDKIKSRTDELQSILITPVDAIIDIEPAIKTKEGMQNRLVEIQKVIDDKTTAKTTLVNLQTVMMQSTKAEYYADSYSNLKDTLGNKGLQGEIVKSGLAPLQETIQDKLGCMGVQHQFYFQAESANGKEVFQFGWMDKFGTKRDYNALSQGEKMLVLTAMLVTFIEKINSPLKVLMLDNIQDLDLVNLDMLITGLLGAGSNIDNIMIACSHKELISKVETSGWHVWDLGGNND
jgi:exonuclease SbcC